MRINLKKLQQMGFHVEHNVENGTLEIWPEKHNAGAAAALDKLSQKLDFNFTEHDELYATVTRLVTFSAIRRASGG